MASFADFGIEVPLSARGDTKARCPECAHTHSAGKRGMKDLSVNIDKGVWNCHRCGWKGGLEGSPKDDWREREFPPAPPTRQEERRSYEKPRPIPKVVNDPVWQGVVDWFADRGISENILARMGVTSAREFCPVCMAEAEHILFPFTRGGEHKNTKHRCAEKHFRQEKDAERLFYNVDAVRDAIAGQEHGDWPVIIVEGECLTGEAEVLTPEGWVRFDRYEGQPVVQVHEGGRLEMVSPLAVVRKPHEGDLLRFANQQRFVTTVTPGHRMVSADRKGRWRVWEAGAGTSSGDSIPRAGELDGPGIALSDDQLALAIAVSADATIDHRRNTGSRKGAEDRYARFGLKKPRKIERLRGILDRLGIVASDKPLANGYQSICFPLPSWTPGRILPHEWIAQASRLQRELILKELIEWDGNSVSERNQTEYSTKYAANATFVQSIAHTSGRVSTIISRSNDHGSWYKVSILHGKSRTSMQPDSMRHPERVSHNGLVYCVTVPTGMFLVREDGCITVTGNCDALSVLEADPLASVISVPDGAPNPNTRNYSAKFEFMKGDEAALNEVRWFVIAVDADEPGATLQEELIRRLGPERCRRVSWPEGIKDANEYLIQYGPKALKAHLAKAQPVPVVGIMTADDVAEELDRLYDHGVDEGIRIGMGALDDHYRIKAPGISVITGIPGHGKSGVLDNILVKLAENHGWHTALFSPEQMPVEMHAKQMMMIHTGKPFDDGPTMRMSRSEMHEAREWVSQHFSFIVPENPTIERIVELTKIECFRHGTKAIVIDPWNELADLAPANMTETQYVQHCLRLFRALALNLKIHIFIVAHPTKLRMKDDGTEPVPTLYDIAGSANFRNKADFGISIWRDLSVDDPNVSIFIQKVRWREQGKIGRVNMNYNPINRRVQSERPVAGMAQRGAW